jgi:hypothetical protein
MKNEFKLSAWPELAAPYHRTPYRRMLCDMSHRYVSMRHLVEVSGLGRQEVRAFIDMLASRQLLLQREGRRPDSIFASLEPLRGWIKRTIST